MRVIEKIIIHCTDSDNPKTTIADIRQWHLERGFDDIGYHWVILSDGLPHKGRPEEVVGAHCEGHNHDSLGIAVHMKNIMSSAQMNALKVLVIQKCHQFNVKPENIFPHNQFNPHKTCPNFDITPLRKYVAQLFQGEQ